MNEVAKSSILHLAGVIFFSTNDLLFVYLYILFITLQWPKSISSNVLWDVSDMWNIRTVKKKRTETEGFQNQIVREKQTQCNDYVSTAIVTFNTTLQYLIFHNQNSIWRFFPFWPIHICVKIFRIGTDSRTWVYINTICINIYWHRPVLFVFDENL